MSQEFCEIKSKCFFLNFSFTLTTRKKQIRHLEVLQQLTVFTTIFSFHAKILRKILVSENTSLSEIVIFGGSFYAVLVRNHRSFVLIRLNKRERNARTERNFEQFEYSFPAFAIICSLSNAGFISLFFNCEKKNYG